MPDDPALAAVKTYRYLRLGMVAMVALLFVAIGVDWWESGRHCLQPSISSSFHTPVRSVFIAVLVTIGVCLVALKGNSEPEDVLLNLAGMLAPGVAFVPTQLRAGCAARPMPTIPESAVVTPMLALTITGGLAAVAAVALALWQRGGTLGLWDRVGIAGAVVVLAGGAGWLALHRQSFLSHAHDVAAVPMFLCIVVVVWLNSRDVQREIRTDPARAAAPRYVPVYRAIALLMLAALVVTVLLRLLTSWTYTVLAVEVVLLVLFAVFWVVQTAELWRRGLRD